MGQSTPFTIGKSADATIRIDNGRCEIQAVTHECREWMSSIWKAENIRATEPAGRILVEKLVRAGYSVENL